MKTYHNHSIKKLKVCYLLSAIFLTMLLQACSKDKTDKISPYPVKYAFEGYDFSNEIENYIAPGNKTDSMSSFIDTHGWEITHSSFERWREWLFDTISINDDNTVVYLTIFKQLRYLDGGYMLPENDTLVFFNPEFNQNNGVNKEFPIFKAAKEEQNLVIDAYWYVLIAPQINNSYSANVFGIPNIKSLFMYPPHSQVEWLILQKFKIIYTKVNE